MTDKDITWSIDAIVADGLVGQTPTFQRGETLSLEFVFEDVSEYQSLLDYLEFPGSNVVSTGVSDWGIPWFRERVPAAAPVDSLVVPIEPGVDVIDVDGRWVIVLDGEDLSQTPSDVRRVSLDVFDLAPLDEYATRDEVITDLGEEPI